MNFKFFLFFEYRSLVIRNCHSLQILYQRMLFRSSVIKLKSACRSPICSKVSSDWQLQKRSHYCHDFPPPPPREHDNGMHMMLSLLMSDNVSMYVSNFDLRFLLSRLSLSIAIDFVRPPVADKDWTRLENKPDISLSSLRQVKFPAISLDCVSTKSDSEFRSVRLPSYWRMFYNYACKISYFLYIAHLLIDIY